MTECNFVFIEKKNRYESFKVRKSAFGNMHTAKTQIRLRNGAVWSESSQCAYRYRYIWILCYPVSPNVEAYLCPSWAHMFALRFIFSRCGTFIAIRYVVSRCGSFTWLSRTWNMSFVKWKGALSITRHAQTQARMRISAVWSELTHLSYKTFDYSCIDTRNGFGIDRVS